MEYTYHEKLDNGKVSWVFTDKDIKKRDVKEPVTVPTMERIGAGLGEVHRVVPNKFETYTLYYVISPITGREFEIKRKYDERS